MSRTFPRKTLTPVLIACAFFSLSAEAFTGFRARAMGGHRRAAPVTSNFMNFGFEDSTWGGFNAWSSAPNSHSVVGGFGQVLRYSAGYGEVVRKYINYRSGAGTALVRCMASDHSSGWCKAYIDSTEIGSVTIPANNNTWQTLNFTIPSAGTGYFAIKCESTSWYDETIEEGAQSGADMNIGVDSLSIPVQ